MRKIMEIWAELRASLWFIPMVMFLGSIVLALGFIRLDVSIDTKWLMELSPVFAISTDGARAMLLAVAGSMLTVVALSFTLTLNAMTHASGQFTPRILRNFMRDRSNQFVLGYFVGIFAYSLLASLSIRSDESVEFIPVLTAFAGLLLTLGGVIVLIFFIHHISASLQITTIIDHIVDDTKKSINNLFPKNLGDPAEQSERMQAWKADEKQSWITVPNLTAGYIQNVDTKGLINFAEENEIIIRMERHIGHFVPSGADLVSITHDTNSDDLLFSLDDEKIETLNKQFAIDHHRMIEQDVGFGIRQIVDIALKALSPGVNDTSTAVNCVQFLGDITGKLARKQFPLKIRSNDDEPRVIALAPTFQDYVEGAYDQIRISGKGNIAIFQYLAEALAYTASCTTDKSRRKALKVQLKLVEDYAYQTLETDYEKEKIRDKLIKARSVFTG